MRRAGGWLAGISWAGVGFLYAPIVVLIVFSLNASRLSASWQGFTWHWYDALWRDEALRAATANTLLHDKPATIAEFLEASNWHHYEN